MCPPRQRTPSRTCPFSEKSVLFSQAVAENQPFKNRVKSNLTFSGFASSLREVTDRRPNDGTLADEEFGVLATLLFQLQFGSNPPYRAICEARGVTPETVQHWQEIPAASTSAFKELELSCLPAQERIAEFHSSGTTGQRPGRHFHSRDSLAVYESSLLAGFRLALAKPTGNPTPNFRFVFLTPPPDLVPNSSLVYMFGTLARKFAAEDAMFLGNVAPGAGWSLDVERISEALASARRETQPIFILGTAFSYVHLVDYLEGRRTRFDLPPGSLLLETGGYKGRSRAMPRAELHRNLCERFGVLESQIICEYGMSELSSQAYALMPRTPMHATARIRIFHFPHWVRARIVSPDTGREVRDGEPGLIQVFDLANVFSVMAIQTEDLGIRHGAGFELIGRAPMVEPRGCSLMDVNG